MSTQELGAGIYYVRPGKTLVYRGVLHKAGDAVMMSDAGAGAHHAVITREAPKAEPRKAEPAKAEAPKPDKQEPKKS